MPSGGSVLVRVLGLGDPPISSMKPLFITAGSQVLSLAAIPLNAAVVETIAAYRCSVRPREGVDIRPEPWQRFLAACRNFSQSDFTQSQISRGPICIELQQPW